jgi:hypothetical protein
LQINLVQQVPEAATFGQQYDIEKDIIPPLPHTCMYRLDVWVNTPLIESLQQQPPDNPQDVTALDRCLHYALLEAGEDSFNARIPISLS